jgi:2-haloacid dehalogenase
MAISLEPKALFFDVFGTCVDWRKSVTDGLASAAKSALSSDDRIIPSAVREIASNLSNEDWGRFAQEWRNSYKQFTKSLSGMDGSDISNFKTVDEHHYDALLQLLREHKLDDLWSEPELQDVTLLWHRLDPWPDSQLGMKCLNTKFETGTLSNGNVSLLQDLKAYSGIEFIHLFSAELFGACKPNPKTYLGACAKLSLKPDECALVAAHLIDLKFAKQNGLRTIYVERPLEEDFSREEIEEAKQTGFVDLWVSANESGFLTVAERLGVDVQGVTGPV